MQIFHIRTGIISMLMCMSMGMSFAQDGSRESHRRVRGTLVQCYPVRIVDAPSFVYIRAVVDSTFPDSTLDAVLYCMQVRAVIDSAEQPTITIPGAAGTRVPVRVISRNDSTVILQPTTRITVDPTAVYQIVVPVRADTITVDSTLTCEAWDGRRGGVIELQATSCIIIDGSQIDASARGYRGGRRSTDEGGTCSLTQACDPALSGRTGEKGESFVIRDPQCVSGHIPWASGGGGGDAHTAGDGAGGNGGAGGRGGDQWSCGLPLGMHGMAGCAVRDTTFDRLIAGGGGGGAHQNNGVGTDGVAGGGIIVLRAPRIQGDTIRVIVDGESQARVANNDGAGGGGAGGTIVLDACEIVVPVRAVVRGGRGGNCGGGHGPGGGGSGGRVLLEPSLLQRGLGGYTFELDGGGSGLNGGPTATFNAMPGERGVLLPLCSRVQPHRIIHASELGIGDIDTLVVLATDTSLNCPLRITHQITLIGSSLLPLIDSVYFDSLTSIRCDRPAADTTVLTVELASSSSAIIPLLGMLHYDTTSIIRHTVTVNFPDSIPSCTWPTDERIVVTRACGLPLRIVRMWTPLRVSAVASRGGIDIAVEAASNEPVDILIATLQGSIVASTQCSTFQRFADRQWRGAVTLQPHNVAQGVYTVIARSSQGITSTIICCTQ